MFNLLQPLWLVAAAAIAIPVIIHWWNVRQGKILKVGSIAFLQESAQNYTRSLKLTEVLLLILRCLLIILLVVLLAKPTWKQSFQNAKPKGWVLIERENIGPAYIRYKIFIDSLMQAGYEFHYFNEGFNKANLREEIKNQRDTVFASSLSYRVLLQQLERMVPAQFPVYLFTTNYLHRLAGSLQPLSLNLRWQTFTPSDSVAGFISKAYAISTDSTRLIVGTSRPAGTVYHYEDIDTKKNSYPGRQKDVPLVADTAALSITIFTSKYFNDVGYIKAATDAIQQFSKHRIRASLVNRIEAVPPAQDWLFWLSELPLPPSVKAKNIFKYQQGEVRNTNSWINTNAGINSAEEKTGLFKLIMSDGAVHQSDQVWSDGFGNPVLTVEKRETNSWFFFTHFDPAWNDLPWSHTFPQLIFALLYPPENMSPPPARDKRAISDNQLLPARDLKDTASPEQKFITTDIAHIFWLLAFMVFCTERFLSFKTRKEAAYA